MRKILSILLCVVTLFGLSITASAASYQESSAVDEVILDTYTTYFEDGSYIVTEITEEVSDTINCMGTRASAVSKTGSKTTSHYNSSNELLYSIKVTATFEYVSGVSVECVGQQYTTSVNASGYTLEDAIATRSNYSTSKVSATASAVAHKKVLFIVVDRIPISVTLYCDYNGNLS